MRNGLFIRRTLATVVAGAALLSNVPDADAQAGSPKAEVVIIHATDCDKPNVDPQIGEVPPLKYKCYKFVDRKTLPLAKAQPSTTALPNGRTFQVVLNDTNKGRFNITASISQPDNKGFLKLADITAEPSKQFHVGGFAYQGGALVLAIRIVP